MSLHFAQLPQDYREMFAKGLAEGARIFKIHKPGHRMGGEFSPDRIEKPMEIFSITVGALKSGQTLSGSTSEGWRVFLADRPPIRSSDVVRTADGDGLVFLGIATGPQNDFTLSLLDELSKAPEFDANDFTVRFFRVKPLNLAALWLASDDAQRDILIPLPPAHKPFVASHKYGAEMFSELMQESAGRKTLNAEIFFAM